MPRLPLHVLRGRRCTVSVLTIVLLAPSASVVTWLYTSAHWRSRAAAQDASWRRVQAELLAEITSLQEEAERARIRAAQVTGDTTGWAEGYKHGCSDMIKAMAALHGAAAGRQSSTEETPSGK
jgi:hypothetical protein